VFIEAKDDGGGDNWTTGAIMIMIMTSGWGLQQRLTSPITKNTIRQKIKMYRLCKAPVNMAVTLLVIYLSLKRCILKQETVIFARSAGTAFQCSK